jgi:4-hydroxy-tetrahydrodipicolinate reductase
LRLAEFAREGLRASSTTGGKGGEIDIHALRLADSPGEHTVIFGLMGETLELSHRALNRDGFARGALGAAKFLAGKPAGLYTMQNVNG